MSEQRIEPPRFATRQDYYAWALLQESGRFELVDGQVLVMAAERISHALAKAGAWRALSDAVREAKVDCIAIPDGVTVEIGTNTAYEPDALVNCGDIADRNGLAAPTPVIIVEIVSPSNRRAEMDRKFGDYFSLPTVRHYLVVQLERRMVLHHRRTDSGEVMTRFVPAGPIVLDPPGITIAAESLFG